MDSNHLVQYLDTHSRSELSAQDDINIRTEEELKENKTEKDLELFENNSEEVIMKKSTTISKEKNENVFQANEKWGLNVNTYINCDLRYFNLKYITELLGQFDVVLIDPPWRIKGGQRNDSSLMFTNSIYIYIYII